MLQTASRRSKWFFMFLFFVAFGFGMSVWYQNVYRGEWSEEAKQQYVEATFRETVFREDVFRSAIESVTRRAESYATDVKVKNDIFAPLPGSKGE